MQLQIKVVVILAIANLLYINRILPTMSSPITSMAGIVGLNVVLLFLKRFFQELSVIIETSFMFRDKSYLL
ncbi:hypothetical protein JTE90_021861 [Oedothorax gibbosus]|uniref:Uncharacterized protein n=1 Tax=Oedothorax gibbosus TaxID=931172 RepID=A0AAV6V067_9ARAC|nr:hypothetical protein JTE90_021861 [Oedothorax gibbosus]